MNEVCTEMEKSIKKEEDNDIKLQNVNSVLLKSEISNNYSSLNILSRTESNEFATSTFTPLNGPTSVQVNDGLYTNENMNIINNNDNNNINETENVNVKKNENINENDIYVSIGPDDFELLCIVGKGSFGKVVQVRYKPTNEIYAMKIVNKKYLISKNSMNYIKSEYEILKQMNVNFPFLINLKFAFQTKTNYFLVMPFINGGELFHHLQKETLLLEDAARFYMAEMVLAIEHLHNLGIVHRDLKPENILLDKTGHICVTDFGLAKTIKADDYAKTICGTDEYMAPEMIRGHAYNNAVDWWALGALLYEMLTGRPPFSDKNKKKLHQKILNGKLFLPSHLNSDTHSILKQLLERNVDKRLGSGKSSMFKIKGAQAVKNHKFFKKIDWILLSKKEVKPPIIPIVKDDLDTTNFDDEFTKLSIYDDKSNKDHPEEHDLNEFTEVMKSDTDKTKSKKKKFFTRFSSNPSSN